jgi:hypothetical protein
LSLSNSNSNSIRNETDSCRRFKLQLAKLSSDSDLFEFGFEFKVMWVEFEGDEEVMNSKQKQLEALDL